MTTRVIGQGTVSAVQRPFDWTDENVNWRGIGYAVTATPAMGWRFVRWDIAYHWHYYEVVDGQRTAEQESDERVSFADNPRIGGRVSTPSGDDIVMPFEGVWHWWSGSEALQGFQEYTSLVVTAVFEQMPTDKGIIYSPSRGDAIVYDIATGRPMCYA